MAKYPYTEHSGSASGTFYATAWQSHVEWMSGLEYDGFPTGQDYPFSGALSLSGGKLWFYEGSRWKLAGGGLNSYSWIKARI